jgi:hypothetical protein
MKYPYPLDRGDLSILSEEDKMEIIHEIASSEAEYFNVILEDDAYGNPHLYGVYPYADREELEEIRRSVWYSWAEPRSHWETLLDIRLAENVRPAQREE